MNEIPIIMCNEKVAEEWINEQVYYGEDRNQYLYHDKTLWKKGELYKEPEKEINLEDLNLF